MDYDVTIIDFLAYFVSIVYTSKVNNNQIVT